MGTRRQLTETSVVSQPDTLRVDRDACVVRGVKLLGWDSTNGRRYDPNGMRDCVPLYVTKVNVDHLKWSDEFRLFASRFGRTLSAEWREDGIYGDLRYNPKHPLAEMFLWACENDPTSMGFSHTVEVDEADTSFDDATGIEQIRKVCSVISVDLVADPATNKGIFESMNPNATPPNPDEKPQEDDGALDPTEPGFAEHLANAIVSVVKDDTLDVAAKKAKINKILAILGDDSKPDAGDEPAPEADDASDDKPESKKQKLDKATVETLISVSQIPESLVTPNFKKQVANAKNVAEALDIIKDRQAIANYKQPTSGPAGGKIESQGFDPKATAKLLRD